MIVKFVEDSQLSLNNDFLPLPFGTRQIDVVGLVSWPAGESASGGFNVDTIYHEYVKPLKLDAKVRLLEKDNKRLESL